MKNYGIIEIDADDDCDLTYDEVCYGSWITVRVTGNTPKIIAKKAGKFLSKVTVAPRGEKSAHAAMMLAAIRDVLTDVQNGHVVAKYGGNQTASFELVDNKTFNLVL
jgi:hypothetical protein